MFILFALMAALANSNIADCGKNALFQITTLSQDPATNVQAGQNISLVVKYSSPMTIRGGTATTTVTYNYIPFNPTVEDLCTKVACPLNAGDHDGSSSYFFPTGVNGQVTTRIEWKDLEGKLLLCIVSTLKSPLFAVQAWKPQRWRA